MSAFLSFEKLTAPPTVLSPNTVYFVSNGTSFDMLISNDDASGLVPLNVPSGGSSDIDPFLLMGVNRG